MATSPMNKSLSFSRFLVPVAILALFIIIGLTVIKMTLNRKPSDHSTVVLESGTVLPDVTFTRLDGKSVQLSELKGKVFLINFWATWCDACMEEMDSLVKLRETYKNKGFEILGVNLDENPVAVASKVSKQYEIHFPIFKDPEGKLAEVFDVRAIPLSVLIDKHRKVLLVKDGEQDWYSSEFRSELENWLKP